MRGRREVEDGLTFRVPGTGNDRAALGHHGPRGGTATGGTRDRRVALKAQRGHRHTRRPVAGLDHQHAVDRRLGNLPVAVTNDDGVDARHFVGDGGHGILRGDTGQRGVRTGRRVEAGVGHHHHHLSAGRARVLHGALQRRHDVVDLELFIEVQLVPDHGPRRGDADDRDAHATAVEEGRRRPAALAVDPPDVGGEQREGRGRERTVEIGKAVVELVIAEHARVVLHGVHRGDDRVRPSESGARGDICQRIALQEVAGIHEDGAPRCRRTQRVENRRNPGKPAPALGGVGEVVPTAHATVDVGGGGDDDLDRRDLGGTGPRSEAGRAEQQCNRMARIHGVEITPADTAERAFAILSLKNRGTPRYRIVTQSALL